MYIKNENILWKDLGESTVLVDRSERELIELNAVAGEIWRLIDGRNDETDISARISETFDVSEKKARKDVVKFIKKLLDMEVILERK